MGICDLISAIVLPYSVRRRLLNFLEGSGTPILTDDRLREMGFGMYEGTEHVTQKPECPVYTLFHDPVHYHAVDGAESLEHLYARSGSFIHDVLTSEFVSGKMY